VALTTAVLRHPKRPLPSNHRNHPAGVSSPSLNSVFGMKPSFHPFRCLEAAKQDGYELIPDRNRIKARIEPALEVGPVQSTQEHGGNL